ncbi:Protein fam72a, partial [Haplosporangium sp. Z 11]
MIRPHNIITNYSRNGYRLNHDHESSEQPRRPHTNNAFQTYSATVERTEAGDWDQPSFPLTADPSSFSSSWRDGALNFRSRHNIGLKEVVRMACCFCETIICERGMKAQLLADQSVALLSTDDAPQSVQLVGTDYRPINCFCKIRDTACLVCGNAIGYHITQPCEKCLNAENNGHLWLFHPEYIVSCLRWDPLLSRPLRWGELPTPDQDYETLSLGKVQRNGPGGKLIIGGM